jgi:hypothetical protein
MCIYSIAYSNSYIQTLSSLINLKYKSGILYLKYIYPDPVGSLGNPSDGIASDGQLAASLQ